MKQTSSTKNIIGIAAHFHDASCCLLQDGNILAAAQEERFSRVKHDPGVPKLSFRYCLESAGVAVSEIDCLAYYETPRKKVSRQVWTMMPKLSELADVLLRLDPNRPEWELREFLGYEGPIIFFEHHAAHAASSFFFSGFAEAAVLTVDGVGEWASGTYGYGNGRNLTHFEEVWFPHSLGLLYSTITDYLGFSVNDGEYKVMGLAPYGTPAYTRQMRALVEGGENGQYRLNLKYFDFQSVDRMFSDLLPELFGQPTRKENSHITQFHKDIAKSLQCVLEEVLIEKANYLHRKTGSENLCMAGGIALNCVANSRILKDGPFKRLFVQPAANDAGGALGAAALAFYGMSDTSVMQPLKHDYFGPEYSYDKVRRVVEASGLPAIDYRGREQGLLGAVAERIASGKVIGWFQGRMEFGPRALGARSILADPRDKGMRDRINELVKKREGFRPFAPAILESRAQEHFDLSHPSPFMLETCQVRSCLDLPAITHVDGSARVQTVNESTNGRFARLLAAFESRTGCPILLNTSFNMRDEPIVCTPSDALVCFLRSEIDCLVLEDFILDRPSPDSMFPWLFRTMREDQASAINQHVYTMF
jgi:carbamoyltransferase